MIARKKPTKLPERYALLSVFDKTGIVEFAKTISSLGYKIISTGGSAKTLIGAGLKVIPIQKITGNPESFDGRMKTISFQIESGILYDRTNPEHVKEAKTLGIIPIDIVVANLYPFEQTIADPKVSQDAAIENIDVGGPTMIRAAAKNNKNVVIITDPSDYSSIANLLKKKKIDDKMRLKLAAKAFRHLSFYDCQIASYLEFDKKLFADEIAIPGRKNINLRYGDNPHQRAAVYIEPNTNSPLAKLQKITGRDLSATNFTDISAGLESVRFFKESAAVVIKHNSPSGIALGSSISDALQNAVAADPESAFGGVIVLNQPMDLKTAKTFANFKEENGVLIDIIAAPLIKNDAIEFVKKVRKSTGIYIFGQIPKQRSNKKHLRFFDGGFIMQDWDDTNANFENWEVVTKIQPTEKQIRQMELAWKFISRIKSNTIIVVDKAMPMTRGIGSGQTSRVRATKIALDQAGKFVHDGILASDSFFPFDDSVNLAAKTGIGAIIQQGGSINDKASIEAANKAKIPMVITHERKFWH